jgi:hypothetical protein
LAITAPTSWDYQLLPLLPFVLIPAGWALRRAFVRPHRRRVVTVLTLIGCGELAFMLLAVPLAQLSLAETPTAAVVRYLAPGIDVPYGTGSEELPRIAAYINTKLPHNARVAATYADDTLRQYVKLPHSVGPWFPNETLGSMSADGFEYGVLVGHDMPPGTIAAQSVAGSRPILSVKMPGHSFATLYKVPIPSLTTATSVDLRGPWTVDAHGITTTKFVQSKDRLSISGRFKRHESGDKYLSMSDQQTINMGAQTSEVKIDIDGHGGAENLYVDLLNPKDGSYFRATVYVNWFGTHSAYLPTSAFQYVSASADSAAPAWGGKVVLRLSTDSQLNVAPNIDVSGVTMERPTT